MDCWSSVKQWLQYDTSKYLVSIILGIILGIIFNVTNTSYVISSLLTLPGPLFLRSLQCAVIPMMFFNITVSIADIYRDGEAGRLGRKVLYFYTLTTFFAVITGCLISVAFSPLLSKNIEENDDEGVDIELLCPKSFGKLSLLPSGSIQCVPNDSNVTRYDRFSLIDSEDRLVNDAMVQRTFLDQILSTFESLVPNNVIQSFAVANIISIIVIGMVFGIGMSHIMSDEQNGGNSNQPASNDGGTKANNNDGSTNEQRKFSPRIVFDFCREMSLICSLIIRWIVKLAPYGIAFLIAGSLSQAGNLIYLLKSVGIYCISVFIGICIHLTFTLPVLFYYYTGENPYSWMFSCRRALLVALSTASSAATLPITIECVIEGGVSPVLANVILPMGANVNMDGYGIFFPCALLFLANSENLMGTITAFTWINIALCCSLGSIGAAPVPSSGMVTLITLWQTVFPSYDVPEAIAYVQAIDFLVDRIATMTNVASDIVIIRMLQSSLNQERATTVQRETLVEVTNVKNVVYHQEHDPV